jgi:hypothetical protein
MIANYDTEFPLKHLPDDIVKPVHAIQDLGQVPVEIAAQSVLTAISFAAQPLGDVMLPRQGRKPLNSFFLTLAESGSGKTTAEKFAMAAVNAHVDALETAYRKELLAHKIELKAYRQAVKAIERQLRDHPRDVIIDALTALGEEPVPPLRPDAIVRMTTYRGLLDTLQDGQPSLAMINDDSGGFIKGTLNDASMVTLLADQWSVTPYRRTIAKSWTVLKDRRLTAHLMVQPDHADKLLHGEHSKDQGIIPRFNIAVAPLHVKAIPVGDRAEQQAVVDAFNARITALLATPANVQNRNELVIERVLSLEHGAEELFVAFMDEMNAKALPGGEYSLIRTSAIRAPENAARLAGSLALFRHGPDAQSVQVEDMSAGIALVYYYLSIKLSLYGATSVDPDEDLAEKTWAWLSERWDDSLISFRDIMNSGSPRQVRRADRASIAVQFLERQGRLTRLEGKHLVRGVPRERVWRIER